MKMTDEEMLNKFRHEVCDEWVVSTKLEDKHWYDMSVGFFLALGADVTKAYRLANDAKYKHEYWQ